MAPKTVHKQDLFFTLLLVIFFFSVPQKSIAQEQEKNLYIFYDKSDSLVVKKNNGHYLFYDEKQIARKKVLLKKSIFLPEGFQEYILFIEDDSEKPLLCSRAEFSKAFYRKDIIGNHIDFRNYDTIYIVEKNRCGYYKKRKVLFEPSL